MAAELTITFKANAEVRKIKLTQDAVDLLFGETTPDPQLAETARLKYRDTIKLYATVLQGQVVQDWMSTNVEDVT